MPKWEGIGVVDIIKFAVKLALDYPKRWAMTVKYSVTTVNLKKMIILSKTKTFSFQYQNCLKRIRSTDFRLTQNEGKIFWILQVRSYPSNRPILYYGHFMLMALDKHLNLDKWSWKIKVWIRNWKVHVGLFFIISAICTDSVLWKKHKSKALRVNCLNFVYDQNVKLKLQIGKLLISNDEN